MTKYEKIILNNYTLSVAQWEAFAEEFMGKVLIPANEGEPDTIEVAFEDKDGEGEEKVVAKECVKQFREACKTFEKDF